MFRRSFKNTRQKGRSGVPYGVGRINHLAFSGTNANVMYTVAPAGLFISKDTGHTWQSTQTDYMGYHSFRCVAVDPTNDSVIYLGYGDFNMSLGYIYDTGVMKSVDFGNSFTSLPNGMDSTVINSIQIDPNNNNNIIAGVNKVVEKGKTAMDEADRKFTGYTK